MKFSSWILILMTTVMTTFNPVDSIMNVKDNQAVEDHQKESRPEKEDYTSLIRALLDFANITVNGKTLLDWDYETLMGRVQNDLGNGIWNNIPQDTP